MIPPRQNGTFSSRLDGNLAKAGWCVYMDKNIAGMKLFKFLPQRAFARAQCLYGNFLSRLDEIPATDAGT